MRAPLLKAAAIGLACTVLLGVSGCDKACKAQDFSKIRADVEAAETALADQDYARADRLADRAIKTIGDRHYEPEALDDTGLHLALADGQRARGDTMGSAKERVAMARTRLDALGRKMGC